VAEAETARIEMVGVSKTFPGVRALDKADLRLLAGEVHALMGENGAGKSTLIKVLIGALRRNEGEIRLDGKPVEINSPGQARALGIGTSIRKSISFSTIVGDEEPDARADSRQKFA